MSKNKKIFIGVIIGVLIIILGAVIIYNLTRNINKEDYKASVDETEYSTDIAYNAEEESEEEIIRRLYLKELRKNYSVESRIDSIEIIELEDKDSLFPNATSEAIFAEVIYSVKSNDINALAANGEIDGKWTINKSACVYIDKVNEEFKIISSGTGW